MPAGAPLGNNNNKKNKPITEAIIQRLHDECELHGVKTKKLYALADKLISRAIDDGDMAAIREVLDRVEGKPAQTLDVNRRTMDVAELTDDELTARINDAIAGIKESGNGTGDKANGTGKLPSVH